MSSEQRETVSSEQRDRKMAALLFTALALLGAAQCHSELDGLVQAQSDVEGLVQAPGDVEGLVQAPNNMEGLVQTPGDVESSVQTPGGMEGLLQSHVLWRHGDRTPINPYPTDPYRWGSYVRLISCFMACLMA